MLFLVHLIRITKELIKLNPSSLLQPLGSDTVAMHELESETTHTLQKPKALEDKRTQRTESAKLKFCCYLLFTLGAKRRQGWASTAPKVRFPSGAFYQASMWSPLERGTVASKIHRV